MKEKISKLFSKQYSLPKTASLNNAVASFTPAEKITFYILTGVFAISALILFLGVNGAYQVNVPKQGGTLTEGLVGTPHFINPLFAVSDGEKDISSLLYSGLMKDDPNGNIQPDLAESYTVSSDGKTYTFTLKNNIYFHDGEPVTADDVAFTIQKATDPALKSPRRPAWEGVKVEVLDPKHVRFTLQQAYAPFIENTTLGILPKHIWNNIDNDQFSQLIELTGSGPYKLNNIQRDASGIPISYTLNAFNDYVLGTPYIETIVFKFYSSEQDLISAYKKGGMDSLSSLSPEDVATIANGNSVIDHSPLPRVFGVFFNQSQAPVLTNKEVRQALNSVVDRDLIISRVLSGYGQAITSPIPFGILQATTSSSVTSTSTSMYIPGTSATTTQDQNVQAAKNLLAKNGWKLNPDSGLLEKKVGKSTQQLKFSLYTANTTELMVTAELLKQEWQSVGAQVDVKSFELGDLNQTIIRPRKYDALLFGEVVGRDLDLYAFWHSSQRNDPGLNVALYTNAKVDSALEQLQTSMDVNKRQSLLQIFQNEFTKDIPAVFIYSPDFIYIVPKSVQNFTIGQISTPSERFANVSQWYLETQKIWKIFLPKTNNSTN